MKTQIFLVCNVAEKLVCIVFEKHSISDQSLALVAWDQLWRRLLGYMRMLLSLSVLTIIV
jgi:hypothetical protein